ncbi:MAG TPA: PfkB family carbohydrate kinase [Vicinamibacterales bacterium]|nr:PfkB family carbohydrate kinase [Vicinamibacterales bacterium]
MPARAAFDVVGVGTNSVDTVLKVPQLPQPGSPSKIHATDKITCTGGQTATALATCAGLGLRTAYIGAIGNDEHGTLMRQSLERRGIDLRYAVHRDAPNHFAVILVDERGDRIVLWGRDRRLTLEAREIAADAIRSARVVHVDDVDVEASIAAASLAREAGVPVTSDLDRAHERMPELVRLVSVPIFAEHVLEALTAERDQERALRKLRREHEGLLCVTLGERGAVALDGDRFVHVPGIRVTAVDTTGAGDVFRGGFIYGLLKRWPTEETLRFANAAAAVSCTRLGAMNGAPTEKEVGEILSKAKS